MISFWISVVPPKIDWTRLIRQSTQSCRRAADSFSRRSKAGLYLVNASRGVRAAGSGRRSPAMGSSGRVAAPRAAAWPDDDAEPAAADIPAVDADVDAGVHRGTAATGPRDARSQPRPPGAVVLPRAAARQSISRPGSGRSLRQHGHLRHPMTTAAARPPSAGWGSPLNSGPFGERGALPHSVVAGSTRLTRSAPGMSHFMLRVPGMDKPPSRYDVTVRVAKDDGHAPTRQPSRPPPARQHRAGTPASSARTRPRRSSA